MSLKKFRDEAGLFAVEGDRMVEEALGSGFEVLAVYRRDEVGQEAMARMSSLSTPPPSLAVVRIPDIYRNAPDDAGRFAVDEALPSSGLVLGLDSIRDPGNFGTILRTADWFGIRDVYASPDTVELFNPKVVQATMGAVFRVRVHYAPLGQTAGRIAGSGGKVYGTFLDGRNIYDCPLSDGTGVPVMIVIGNEANGISPEVASEVTDRLSIPSFGESKCESLNAAAAAAVTIAEFRRRSARGTM